MRRPQALAAAALTCWLSLPVAAQQMALEASDAAKCLTPPAAERGAPEYPAKAFVLRDKGRVKVALAFTTPTTPPAVTVLEQEGDDSFVDAVEAHVRDLRVPCHDGGVTPAELVFDYVFRPDDRQVHWSPPAEGNAAQRKAQLACVVHESGNKAPAYPENALRANVQGRVLVRLRYEAADQAPVAEFLSRLPAEGSVRARRAEATLVGPLQRWVTGYRMPCRQGRPISTVVVFVYRIEGEAFGFRPGLTLMSLLPMVRGIQQQRLAFDFNRMGCPFDLVWQYFQPALANKVGEVGSQDPARRPFLEWLAQVELDLPESSLVSVFGDEAKISVPCMKIDLHPKESS